MDSQPQNPSPMHYRIFRQVWFWYLLKKTPLNVLERSFVCFDWFDSSRPSSGRSRGGSLEPHLPAHVIKYPMKMKWFGLSETKLFHFHGIFKTNEIKSAKGTPSSTHLNPPPPPSRNPGSAPAKSNNFSVILGRVFLGWTSAKQGWMCLAQWHNTVKPLRLEPVAPLKGLNFTLPPHVYICEQQKLW